MNHISHYFWQYFEKKSLYYSEKWWEILEKYRSSQIERINCILKVEENGSK
jgi:hypothetical protein